jgi:hypothetical protein
VFVNLGTIPSFKLFTISYFPNLTPLAQMAFPRKSKVISFSGGDYVNIAPPIGLYAIFIINYLFFVFICI